MSSPQRYTLTYSVPPSHLEETKKAVFAAGAGSFEDGKYVQVAYESTGTAQFLPVSAKGAVPHTGSVDTLARIEEVRVEIHCGSPDIAKASVAALKQAHPFEVVAYEVYKIEQF
ncbi:hypothetical protein BP5796_05995 [Coleophoma crateriformis]|uniref:ATP phosphoribosyltransferase n=1 Tax=Coleophoma crateriformis TaxID=565419 RepID=A0A3D8RVR1_9HELO|nr:hypothetical protein BP5796_05995 [Coleophoma crateriformis]